MIYSTSGLMRRSRKNCDDNVKCSYRAMFFRYNKNVIYATVSQDTHIYHQITAHARMIVYDDVAFIVDSKIYYHNDEYTTYKTDIGFTLYDNWLEPFKPYGIKTLYNRDRSHEAYILTQRIFHNVCLDLPNNITDLPIDIIRLIQNINLENIGFDYAKDPGRLAVHPFKVQAINALDNGSEYRVVSRNDNADDVDDEWSDIPDIIREDEFNNNDYTGDDEYECKECDDSDDD